MYERNLKTNYRKLNNIIWGVMLILFAVAMFLKAFDIIDFKLFFKNWWALFLIIPGFAGLITGSRRGFSTLILLVGVLIILKEYYDFDLGTIITALVLLVVGFNLIKGSRDKRLGRPGRTVSDNEHVSAILGGSEVDLSNQVFTKDLTINCDVILGGIEIIVPENVGVVASGECILGGVENKHEPVDPVHTLTIRYTCILGGMEIK